MREIHFILYVANQTKSKGFYQRLLKIKPILDVPGMTEFQLHESVKLGLMPENGIAKILSKKMPHPKLRNGIPGCELYLKVKNAYLYMKRGIEAGAVEVSRMTERNWGDITGYISDPDGHIIALAESS